jgi:phage virion morphogenesis protein
MITVTVNDAAFRADLAKLYGRMSDLTPVMQDIGSMIESRVSNRFETRTDPAGQRWSPWAPSTIESYPDDGNHQLLDRYGDMLLSLSSEATKDTARIGFGKPYATFHEFGTKYMPRRGLLFADPEAGSLSQDGEKSILDVITAYLTDGL